MTNNDRVRRIAFTSLLITGIEVSELRQVNWEITCSSKGPSGKLKDFC